MRPQHGERAEWTSHLEWCKERALAYLDQGDPVGAFSSMVSDLRKHPVGRDHIGIELGRGLLVSGKLQDSGEVRRWIEGFR